MQPTKRYPGQPSTSDSVETSLEDFIHQANGVALPRNGWDLQTGDVELVDDAAGAEPEPRAALRSRLSPATPRAAAPSSGDGWNQDGWNESTPTHWRSTPETTTAAPDQAEPAGDAEQAEQYEEQYQAGDEEVTEHAYRPQQPAAVSVNEGPLDSHMEGEPQGYGEQGYGEQGYGEQGYGAALDEANGVGEGGYASESSPFERAAEPVAAPVRRGRRNPFAAPSEEPVEERSLDGGQESWAVEPPSADSFVATNAQGPRGNLRWLLGIGGALVGGFVVVFVIVRSMVHSAPHVVAPEPVAAAPEKAAATAEKAPPAPEPPTVTPAKEPPTMAIAPTVIPKGKHRHGKHAAGLHAKAPGHPKMAGKRVAKVAAPHAKGAAAPAAAKPAGPVPKSDAAKSDSEAIDALLK